MRRLFLLLVPALLVSPALSQEPQSKAKTKAAYTLPDSVTATRDIEYAKAGDVSLKLDVYKPKADSTKSRPCIVWIHGGGWQGGNKSSGASRVGPLVESGDYVGASVGYRLTDVASWPAQIHDCKAAIRFLRASASKYGIDADRIGVWGASAGGHLVSLLGAAGDVKDVEGSLGTTGVSSRVTCVVDFCGPSDFLLFGLDSPRMNEPGSAVYKLFGGPPREKSEMAKQASPATYVSKDDPPFLIMHGTADATVPLNQAERLYEAQKQAGMDTTFVKIINAPHGIGGSLVDERVRAFLDRHLLGKDVAVSGADIPGPAEPVK